MTAEVQAQNFAADDVPTLETAEMSQVLKQSKRYAKSMAKLGLKPEPNIVKVNIRKTGSLSFIMAKPEVYRFPGTNTFVIFGEAQLEDMGALAQEAAARAAVYGTEGEGEGEAAAKVEEVAEDAKEENDEDCDAGDLPEKEINMVMSQAKVSRGKAIKALKNNKGDMVNAIMELTM